MYEYYLAIVLIPLAASIVAGLAGHKIGRAGAHWVTIVGVGISFVLSVIVLKNMFRKFIHRIDVSYCIYEI